MAPHGLLTACVGLLLKPGAVLSCPAAALRWNRLLPAPCVSLVRSLTAETSSRPKRPLNGYMRFLMQQKPIIVQQNPETKLTDIIMMVARQWRTMSLEQKQPFEEASLRERQRFKVELQHYQSQLTPDQLEQQILDKQNRMAKRKSIRRKRELNILGKPKRARSPFNIFMSENFDRAIGDSMQGKMISLIQDWRSLLTPQRQVYKQLAEDDKIRYKNEMKSWEEHMCEIGREDLLRERTMYVKKKAEQEKKAKQQMLAAEKRAAKKALAAETNPARPTRKKASSAKKAPKRSKKT